MQEALRFIYAAARINPENPAIIFVDRVITFRMLLQGILSVEAILAELKVEPDKAVGILIENPARHMIVALALAKHGVTSATLTVDLVPIARQIGISTVLTDQRISDPFVRQLAVRDDWFTAEADIERWSVNRQPDNRIMRVIFSSGSTGFSKAFGHSNRASFERIMERMSLFRVGDERAFIGFGLSTEVGMCLCVRVLMQGRTLCFDEPVNESIHLINFLTVGFLAGSPQQVRQLILQQARTGIRPNCVRQIHCGGSAMTAELLAGLKSSFRAEIFDSYGSTEAGATGVASGRILDERATKGARFLPLKDIRIVAEDGGQARREGLLAIRSTHMAWPFTGDLDETNAIKGDGWFYPAEVGYFDDDGLLVLTGRANDVINIGGVKTSPEAVEAVLAQHSDVIDVAVMRIDQRDPAGARIWVAVVSARDITANELSRFLSDKGAPLEIDRLVRVDSIPRTVMGKIAREDVRKTITGLISNSAPE
jgi:acyl-coenzyme A synthetase/AMP-(fatty) acid ligase